MLSKEINGSKISLNAKFEKSKTSGWKDNFLSLHAG